MNKDSNLSRVRDYIKATMPWAQGYQLNALTTFVSAIFDKQTGCQAELARTQGKQEAACKRLSRLIHNQRLSPKWLAEGVAHQALSPSFQHIEKVPEVELRGGFAQVFAGAFEGATSPAEHYSDIIGADLAVHSGAELTLPLNSTHEHALLLLAGDAEIEGRTLDERNLYYLGTARSEIRFGSRAGARSLLIGGPSFHESILMWWNFVARTPEEITEARTAWEERRGFGEVKAYQCPRLSAPPLAPLARPNPAS
jgi:hypothetical protein